MAFRNSDAGEVAKARVQDCLRSCTAIITRYIVKNATMHAVKEVFNAAYPTDPPPEKLEECKLAAEMLMDIAREVVDLCDDFLTAASNFREADDDMRGVLPGDALPGGAPFWIGIVASVARRGIDVAARKREVEAFIAELRLGIIRLGILATKISGKDGGKPNDGGDDNGDNDATGAAGTA